MSYAWQSRSTCKEKNVFFGKKLIFDILEQCTKIIIMGKRSLQLDSFMKILIYKFYFRLYMVGGGIKGVSHGKDLKALHEIALSCFTYRTSYNSVKGCED